MIQEVTADGGFAVPGHDPLLAERFPEVEENPLFEL
jgi:hypothetical protein